MTMKKWAVYISLLVTVGCNKPVPRSNVDIADKFIASFYSFNRDSLAGMLSSAQTSHGEILYYQGWAECAHYAIVHKGTFVMKNDSLVLCPITVRDDLMSSLNIDFNVTDTFHVTIIDGRINSVTTSSNDLPRYYEAKEWVKKNRPEYIEKPCEGIWQGGPTPCECVEGMIRGFRDFIASVE